MTTQINELQNQITSLRSSKEESDKKRETLEQEKVSLEMKMAEVEEEKDGKF